MAAGQLVRNGVVISFMSWSEDVRLEFLGHIYNALEGVSDKELNYSAFTNADGTKRCVWGRALDTTRVQELLQLRDAKSYTATGNGRKVIDLVTGETYSYMSILPGSEYGLASALMFGPFNEDRQKTEALGVRAYLLALGHAVETMSEEQLSQLVRRSGYIHDYVATLYNTGVLVSRHG